MDASPNWAIYRVVNRWGGVFYASTLTSALAYAAKWGGEPRYIRRQEQAKPAPAR